MNESHFLLIVLFLANHLQPTVINNGIINGGITTQSLAQTPLDLIPEDTPIRAPTVISKKKRSSKKTSCAAVRYG